MEWKIPLVGLLLGCHSCGVASFMQKKRFLFRHADVSFWFCLFLTMEANYADIFLIYWKVKCAFATEISLSVRLGTRF